jgi:hypothetical protein
MACFNESAAERRASSEILPGFDKVRSPDGSFTIRGTVLVAEDRRTLQLVAKSSLA